MECLYTHYAPGSSELPDMSKTDITMFGGRCFQYTQDQNSHPWKDFLEEFHSLFWFSYRKDFPAIPPSNFTTDAGWGCMLRSGQMMFAQALVAHCLGRDWRKKQSDSIVRKQYYEIFRYFEDKPSASFSVHKIAQIGTKFGKNVGEWFGPSTIAQVLGDLVTIYRPANLAVYTSNDSTLYLDEITDICGKIEVDKTNNNAPHKETWKPLFIIIPLRLGLDHLNAIYLPNLKQTLNFPQSVGIVGGKPRAAMFFVAVQDENVFYLDPHVVQPTVSMDPNTESFSTETFHNPIPQKMPFTSIDPSLALGFCCKDQNDFIDFWKRATQMSREDNPLFGVETEAPDYRKKEPLSLATFEDDLVIL